ncbi:MAG: HAD family phosphatase [Rhodospirillaceae bacterium]|nr:HAD family phosphatase [Rhodospirillaceae bacterium]
MTAIIFDMDGVLVDSEILYRKGEKHFFSRIGLTYDPAVHRRRFMGVPSEVYFERLNEDHQTAFGRPLPDDFQSALHAYWRSLMATELQPVSNAADFLAGLTLRKAVASSSTLKSIRLKLTKTKLIGYFGADLYSGDQVANGKPHPDLFLFVADRVGCKPSDCIVIEDSENGVTAAARAGMRVIGFTGGLHYEDKAGRNLIDCGAEQCVSGFDELQDLLAR